MTILKIVIERLVSPKSSNIELPTMYLRLSYSKHLLSFDWKEDNI